MQKLVLVMAIGLSLGLAGCGRDPGPAGPKGETGAQGPAGPQGPQGDPATYDQTLAFNTGTNSLSIAGGN